MTKALKKIPGVPLLYIILNTMVLDKPSERTLKHVEAVQLGEIVNPIVSLQSLKEKEGLGKDGEDKRGKKRKRKSSNPNPLSCLKKKKKQQPMPPQLKRTDGEKKKRIRKKKRRPVGGEKAVGSDPVNA